MKLQKSTQDNSSNNNRNWTISFDLSAQVEVFTHSNQLLVANHQLDTFYLTLRRQNIQRFLLNEDEANL